MKDAVLEIFENTRDLAREVRKMINEKRIVGETGNRTIDSLAMDVARCRRVLNQRYGLYIQAEQF